jgi:hypothetical protein
MGVNSSEDARHCSVLYISKYFVVISKGVEGVFDPNNTTGKKGGLFGFIISAPKRGTNPHIQMSGDWRGLTPPASIWH